MPTDPGILTLTLKAFLDTFLAGYGRLHGDALTLLHWLALIDLGLAALYWMFYRDNVESMFLQKVLAYGFWVWLVGTWITFAPLVITGFIQFGLNAGGSTITVQEFTNPSKIAELGLLATEPIWKHIKDYGWTAALHPVDIWMSGLLGLVILAAYMVVAIEMFVFFLQFYIKAVLSIILLPFGINHYTSFIADHTFTALLADGIKCMALAFVTSASIPVLIRLQLPPNPQWGQMVGLLVGAWAIACLCLLTGKWAVPMFTRGAQLTAGVFAATTVGGMMVAGSLGHALRPSRDPASSRTKDAANMPPSRNGHTPGGVGGHSASVRPATR